MEKPRENVHKLSETEEGRNKTCIDISAKGRAGMTGRFRTKNSGLPTLRKKFLFRVERIGLKYITNQNEESKMIYK